ncbi:MAG: dTDP-4-amino-4,6-dideoxygalactose transaminase [Desulfitobacteriaceae bacterium]|nr:dTDP-4-amino-4,6-dideoxygalactose transaminase [Desulfitobacteriaceae bacterium]
MMKVPFTKIYTSGRELLYMQDCLVRGDISGSGFYTHKVQEYIQNSFNCRKALLTTSGTTALEMAALLINLQPGDEVIMPSFTFVSTANAVMLRGALPVFVDIDPATLNIDHTRIRDKINEHTKAIIPVHYGGIACNMEKIMEIAAENNLYVIEDAAQAVNSTYNGKYLGTIGHIGCYSFHGTKNIVCGEGGAILINTGGQSLLNRADIIWEKGTNRTQFLQGQADKYTWMDLGSSYLPADILAAFLYAQLEEMQLITSKRENIYQYYCTHLWEYQLQGLIRLPSIPNLVRSNYHLFYLLLPSLKKRDYVLEALKEKGIHATFHYIPLHSSPMGSKLGYKPDDLPVTEKTSRTLLRLPIYPQMSLDEQRYVVDNLKLILERLN